MQRGMNSFFSKLFVASALVIGAVSGAACSDSNAVDSSNGKAISDLDIGGDITLDKGKTQQMTATVEYADGTKTTATTSSDLVWNIGNTGVATISKDGVVTAVAIGATTIKATYQGKESSSQALIVN